MRDSGLTLEESNVMKHLCDGYSEFLKLEMQHPSEMQDFINAIHQLQSILAMRVIRRNYPNYWLIHKDTNTANTSNSTPKPPLKPTLSQNVIVNENFSLKPTSTFDNTKK